MAVLDYQVGYRVIEIGLKMLELKLKWAPNDVWRFIKSLIHHAQHSNSPHAG